MFTQTSCDREGYPIREPDSTTCVGAIETAEEFGKRIHLEAWKRRRMRYPKFRRQHLFVGTGVIEAGCKTLIGSRCKQSGMFWTVRGASRTRSVPHHFCEVILKLAVELAAQLATLLEALTSAEQKGRTEFDFRLRDRIYFLVRSPHSLSSSLVGTCSARLASLVGIDMRKAIKGNPKPRYAVYEKLLRHKAEEVRRSMSAQKVTQLVSRLDVPSDEGDLSQQSHEEWIFLNRNTLDMKLLREVQDALHRIELGTYGICYRCEEPISGKRLDAVPWAKYCVPCQERIAMEAARGEAQDDEE